MKVLVTGATGFIASQIVADLLSKKNQVVCCVRDVQLAEKKFPSAEIVYCDFKNNEENFWKNVLTDVDAVINCAGILGVFEKNKMWQVHFETPKTIFKLAKKMSIKHLVQISALGVDTSDTEFAKSKKAFDDYLISEKISSFIVRPSLVYGTGSFGGTSLFRGLSALPWAIPLPGSGQQQFQPIYIKDVSKAVLTLLQRQPNNPTIIDLVGPEKISIKKMLPRIRQWLGLKSARLVKVPMKIISIFTVFFDVARSPTLNSTSLRMLTHNNITSPEKEKACFEMIGFKPKKFENVLLENPSYVQDRWHAKLYFLRPLLRYSIAFVWLASAFVSLFLFPKQVSFLMLKQLGITEKLLPLFFYGSIFVDFLLGFLTLINFEIRKVGMLQLLIFFIYSLIITIYLPIWWTHPFGPMIKNIPLFVAVMVMMTLESNR